MKINLLFFFLVISIANCYAQTDGSSLQKTWTYTYLKAKKNQKDNLKQFLEKNWFAMDRIAVQKGLFNTYQLLENTNASDSSSWDFIVAVEYFTKGTYADIQEEWLEIRKNHQKVLIEGLDFPQLGQIVNSEELIRHSYAAPELTCTGKHIEMLKPYLGLWHEYLVTDEEDKLYGKLAISIDPMGCSLQKNFELLTDSFAYATLGYFDAAQGTWMETYVFSNGRHAIYQWIKDGDDFLLEIVANTSTKETLSRNRWTKPTANTFQIIVEQSTDNGKSWEVESITKMKRIEKRP